MSAPYPMLNGTLVNSDLSQMLVYANSVTNFYFIPMVLLAFFIIVLVGGMFATMRNTARPRFELALAAASFATFGFALILSTVNGLLSPWIFIINLAVLILSILWIYLSSD